jgi:hypothetical protein
MIYIRASYLITIEISISMHAYHPLWRLSPKSWRSGFYLCILLSLFANNLTAQDRSISGTVTDAQNAEPLIGVTIQPVGSTSGTITDVDGGLLTWGTSPAKSPSAIKAP